jgi:hypothetical protein
MCLIRVVGDNRRIIGYVMAGENCGLNPTLRQACYITATRPVSEHFEIWIDSYEIIFVEEDSRVGWAL